MHVTHTDAPITEIEVDAVVVGLPVDGRLSPSAAAVANAGTTPPEVRRLAVEDLLLLMREARTAGAAETELARRGFRPSWLRLAAWINHPEATVRRDRIGRLIGMSGVDARPWLLWLARDEAPEVRLAALSRLMVSGDPTLLGRVRQMALEDDDPRIQDLAQRAERIARGGKRNLPPRR